MAEVASVAERIAAGALWLDKKAPGWERRLDLSGLDMQNCEACVVGQAVGWEASRFELGRPHLVSWNINHGFESSGFAFILEDPSAGWRDRVLEDYEALERAWTALVKERFDTGNLSDADA